MWDQRTDRPLCGGISVWGGGLLPRLLPAPGSFPRPVWPLGITAAASSADAAGRLQLSRQGPELRAEEEGS